MNIRKNQYRQSFSWIWLIPFGIGQMLFVLVFLPFLPFIIISILMAVGVISSVTLKKGNCPYCGSSITINTGTENCPKCKNKIMVSDGYFIAAEDYKKNMN